MSDSTEGSACESNRDPHIYTTPASLALCLLKDYAARSI
jgi:hypothetical protein